MTDHCLKNNLFVYYVNFYSLLLNINLPVWLLLCCFLTFVHPTIRNSFIDVLVFPYILYFKLHVISHANITCYNLWFMTLASVLDLNLWGVIKLISYIFIIKFPYFYLLLNVALL